MSRRSGGLVKSIYGTASDASAHQVLAANVANEFLQIQNTSVSDSIAFSFFYPGVSGSNAPVINGAGYTLGPLGSATFDTYVPKNALYITCTGSGDTYTVTYA